MRSLTKTNRIKLGSLLVIGLLLSLGACASGDSDADQDPAVVEDGSDGTDDDSIENGSEADETEPTTSSDGGDTASIAACEVLSLSDVTAAGVPATAGPTQNEANPNFDQCDFSDESGATVLSVSVFPPSRGGGAISDQEAIDGIGAEAFYSPSQQVLNVTLDDGTFVSLFVPDSSLDVRSILIELAESSFG